MGADIVNLRQARKQKARAQKEAKAAQDRKLFGESKGQRRHREAIEELEKTALDRKQMVSGEGSGRTPD